MYLRLFIAYSVTLCKSLIIWNPKTLLSFFYNYAWLYLLYLPKESTRILGQRNVSQAGDGTFNSYPAETARAQQPPMEVTLPELLVQQIKIQDAQSNLNFRKATNNFLVISYCNSGLIGCPGIYLATLLPSTTCFQVWCTQKDIPS